MYLQYRHSSLEPREVAALKLAKGLKERHSAQVGPTPVSKPSDDPKFVAPYRIKKISKRRRFNGSRLSDELRHEVERRREANRAFHAELRASLGR